MRKTIQQTEESIIKELLYEFFNFSLADNSSFLSLLLPHSFCRTDYMQ